MISSKSEWFFIVNPRAGSGKTMSEWVPAEKKLDQLGIPYTTEYTTHKRHATELAFCAASEGYRKIMAVGGDGSVHEVFNGIMQWCDADSADPSEFVMGVIPIGSGNDWIKSTGVPHKTDEVIQLIAEESFARMDVIKAVCADGRVCYMCNIGGIGFDSHVCQRVNAQKESGMRGRKIYLDALQYTIRHVSPINVQVRADGRDIYNGSVYSIALGNGRYSGSGMRQVPEADMNDGMSDYMIVPEIGILKVIKQLPKLFNGKLNESADTISGKCRTLQVLPCDGNSSDIIEFDGEIEGTLPFELTVTGQKIGILVGRKFI